MKGTIYMIPCPISDERAVWDVLPRANLAVMNSLDYFIVENTRTARRFLSRAGIERKIDTLEALHFGHSNALSEILAPHSLQLTNAIIYSLNTCRAQLLICI